MSLSLDKFIEITGAEMVGGRLIVGERDDRRFVGSVEDGVFTLNEDGQRLQAAFEAGQDVAEVQPVKKRGRPAKDEE